MRKKKIQIWAKAKIDNTIQGTLVYFLSKTDLSIKDVLEFEDYEYVIDEETNKNTIFNIVQEVNAENGDIVILQRNGKVDYIGIVKKLRMKMEQKKEK